VFTSFPDGPRSSSPSAVAFDDVNPRRRRRGGIVLNEHGEVVPNPPDEIPSGWTVTTRIVAKDSAGMLDSAAGVVAGGAALSLADVFEALPRGLQRRRFQVETDIVHASDAFERGAALRLCEVTIRECLNIADLAEKSGSVPWDPGVSDPGILAQAARAAADYLRGFSDSSLRMMGTSPAASSNGVGAAGDRAIGDSASVSDRQTAAFDAHQAMKRSYGDALRGAVSAPAPAWSGSSSFGGAAVSDEDRAYSAHEEMKRSISDGWRTR
jgi:hypothetical protein